MRLALLATLLLTATAGTAAAQSNAPGSCECEAMPPPAAHHGGGWDGRKWGIGLRATSITLHPESNPDAESEWSGGGLQLRWRMNPRWELEGSIDGVREQLGDDIEGDRQLDMATIAVRYHLSPYRRWDFYGLVGFGVTSEVVENGDAKQELTQAGHFALGAGVERRFGRFGIAAELRAVGIGPAESVEGNETQPVPPRDPMGSPVPPLMAEPEGQSGGQFSLAGTFYF